MLANNDVEQLELQGKNSCGRWLWIGWLLLVIAACLHSADRPIGGGDTWVAMANGRYTVGPWAMEDEGRTWQMRLLDNFGVHLTKKDYMGAKTRDYIPGDHEELGWVNQNWLTHVFFFKMREVWGENSIVIYKFIQALLTGLFAYWAARVLGAHAVLAGTAAAFGMLLSRSFIDLRPNQSSIFYAAAMMLVLAWWLRRGNGLVMLWMIPVMLLWSNVHGGFIYAMMVFTGVAGAYLISRLFGRRYFVNVSWRKYLTLLGGLVSVWVIPGVFSPFGWENVSHPLIVATGREGNIWRDVVEWRPIWDKAGFGNEMPYVWFLGLLAVVFVAWWLLFFFKPVVVEVGKGRRKRNKTEIPWPKIDLAMLGVMAITVYMSIMSRRFIFLGGVVVSPFLAKMAQDVVNMIGLLRRKRRDEPLQLPKMSRKMSLVVGGVGIVAAGVLGTIFGWCMWDIYYRQPYDGNDYSVFRRMVSVQAQPVEAMRFFDDNKIEGIVFNEWVNGGFITFNQEANAETGQVRCKVFMDGRSQAAYKVEHFLLWTTMKAAISKIDKKNREVVSSWAKQLGVSVTAPAFFDAMMGRVYAAAKSDDKKIKVAKRNAIISLSNAKLYDAVLERAGVNVVLLSMIVRNPKMSVPPAYELLMSSGNWECFYIDNRNAIFLRSSDERFAELFENPSENVKYADEATRKLCLGYLLCHRSAKSDRVDGLEMLMSVEPKYYMRNMYDTIVRTGQESGKLTQVKRYFERQQEIFGKKVAAGGRFGRSDSLACAMHAADMLRRFKGPGSAEHRDKYEALLKEYRNEMNKLRKESREGWLW